MRTITVSKGHLFAGKRIFLGSIQSPLTDSCCVAGKLCQRYTGGEQRAAEPGGSTPENLLSVSGRLFEIRSSVIMVRYGTEE